MRRAPKCGVRVRSREGDDDFEFALRQRKHQLLFYRLLRVHHSFHFFASFYAPPNEGFFGEVALVSLPTNLEQAVHRFVAKKNGTTAQKRLFQSATFFGSSVLYRLSHAKLDYANVKIGASDTGDIDLSSTPTTYSRSCTRRRMWRVHFFFATRANRGSDKAIASTVDVIHSGYRRR